MLCCKNLAQKLLLVIFIFGVSAPVVAEVVKFDDGSSLSGQLLNKTSKHIYLLITPWELKIPNAHVSKIQNDSKNEQLAPGLEKKIAELFAGNDSAIKKLIAGQASAKNFAVLSLLLKPLQQEDWQARSQAFSALSNLPCRAVTCLLINLCGHSELGGSAAEALSALYQKQKFAVGQAIVEAVQENDQPGRPLLIEVLGNTRQRRYLALLTQLTYCSEQKIAIAAIEAIGDLGCSQGQDSIEPFLLGSNQELLRQAIISLGKIGSWKDIPQVMYFLDANDSAVAAGALWSLRKLSGENYPLNSLIWQQWWQKQQQADAAIHLLEQGLEANDCARVTQAVLTLGECRGQRYLARIVDLVNHESSLVRKAVCVTLENFQDFLAIQALIELLDDNDGEIRQLSWKILQRTTSWELPLCAATWRKWIQIKRLSNEQGAALLQLVASEDAAFALRCQAIKELMRQRNYRLEKILLQLLARHVRSDHFFAAAIPEAELQFYLTLVHSLRSLQTWKAMALLANGLSCRQRQLQRACYCALLQISGKYFPCESGPWLSWVEHYN